MSRKPRSARLHFQIVRAVLVLVACCGAPRSASADWLLTPFLGIKLDGETTLFNPERGAEQSGMTLGGSIMLLSDGLFGVEGDFGYSPAFFGSKTDLVESSRVLTLTGNVVIAAPIQFTRESLRPFVVAGIGLIDARVRAQRSVLVSNMDELALDVGVGALGSLTPRTSVRFEVRRFQNLTTQKALGGSLGDTRLRFWRADIGLAFRY